MQRETVELSFEECETWMRELGYVDGKKLAWERLLKEADVGTDQYNLKKRWNKGEAPKDRAKIRDTLLAAEKRRKERTSIGQRLVGLDEWIRRGQQLALDPKVLAAELERVGRLADAVQAKHDADLAKAAAQAKIDEQMGGAFSSITAKRR